MTKRNLIIIALMVAAMAASVLGLNRAGAESGGGPEASATPPKRPVKPKATVAPTNTNRNIKFDGVDGETSRRRKPRRPRN